MTTLMHKIEYANKGSREIHLALFTDTMEAQRFHDELVATNECTFVSLNKWKWQVEIED